MLKERLIAVALLCACIPFMLAVENLVLGAVVLVPALVALVAGPRLRVERSTEAAIGFAALVVGVLAPRAFPLEGDTTSEFLSERARLFACPILVFVAARALLVAPTYGARGTLALALVGMTAAGRAKMGFAYAACVVAFLLVSCIALAANDGTRALPERGRLSHALRVIGALVVGGALAGAVGFGIPKVHTAIIDRLLHGSRDKSGFSTELSLGAMTDMQQSDSVVLRIRNRGVRDSGAGGAPDYLRGAVFSSYYGSSWHANVDEPREYVAGADAPKPGEPAFELEFVSKPERYFLPLDSSLVIASNGNYVENHLGVRWPATSKYAKRIWYSPAPNERLHPPTKDDDATPYALRPALDDLLAELGVDRNDAPEVRVAKIREGLLERYAYSVKFERTHRADAVLDFLTTHKEGHCEYFASAYALLARRAGVPARVVTGFRVAERSPIDDYWIVRSRDAHAWVEVFIDDRWMTVDATPAGGQRSPRESSLAGAVFDWMRTTWEKADDFLSARSPFELTVALVGLIGLLLLIRSVRARRARKAAPKALADAALPAFEALERALAKEGLARAPSETLEVYARRLERSDRAFAAGVVRAYADHRYGGVDSVDLISRRLEEVVAGMTVRAPAPR